MGASRTSACAKRWRPARRSSAITMPPAMASPRSSMISAAGRARHGRERREIEGDAHTAAAASSSRHGGERFEVRADGLARRGSQHQRRQRVLRGRAAARRDHVHDLRDEERVSPVCSCTARTSAAGGAAPRPASSSLPTPSAPRPFERHRSTRHPLEVARRAARRAGPRAGDEAPVRAHHQDARVADRAPRGS